MDKKRWRPLQPETVSMCQALGKRLRQKRLEMGMTQGELADMAGMFRPDIVAVEAGRKNLTLTSIVRLSRASGTTFQFLLFGAG